MPRKKKLESPLLSEQVDKLNGAFSVGASDEEACAYAGITIEQLEAHQRAEPSYVTHKINLKRQMVLRARQTVAHSIGTSSSAAIEYLITEERLRKERQEREERAVKRPPWRPAKFKPEFGQMAIDYMLNYQVRERIVDRTAGGGTATKMETLGIPTIEGFAVSIGTTKQQLYEWCKEPNQRKSETEASWKNRCREHAIFRDAFTYAQQLQEGIVHEHAAAGHLDRTFVGLYMTNKLGYKSKQDVDLTSNGERIQVAPVIVSEIAPREKEG